MKNYSSVKCSVGQLALLIALAPADVDMNEFLRHVCIGIRKSIARPKKSSLSVVFKHLQSIDPKLSKYLVNFANLLTNVGHLDAIDCDSTYSQDPLSDFVQNASVGFYDQETLEQSFRNLSSGLSPTLNYLSVTLLMNWLLSKMMQEKQSELYGEIISMIFNGSGGEGQTNLANRTTSVDIFLRVLLNSKMASLENFTDKVEIEKPLKLVCNFIRENPSSFSVCFGKMMPESNICQFTGEMAVNFVRKILSQNQDDNEEENKGCLNMKAVEIAVKLCPETNDLNELARIVVKKRKSCDSSQLASVLLALLEELHNRGEEIDEVFIDHCSKFVTKLIDNEEFSQFCADFLRKIACAASQNRSLRKLFCKLSLEQIEIFTKFWYPQSADLKNIDEAFNTFFSNFLTMQICDFYGQNVEHRLKLFSIVASVVPKLDSKHANKSKLINSGIRCICNGEWLTELKLSQLMLFLSHCTPADYLFSKQSDLLAILNGLASMTSTETFDKNLAIKVVKNCLNAVKVPLSQFYQSFVSISQSLLLWSGVSCESLQCLLEICCRFNLDDLKARYMSKFVGNLMEQCLNYVGPDKWMIHVYIMPIVVRCAYANHEIINNDVTQLIDATESIFFDNSKFSQQAT